MARARKVELDCDEPFAVAAARAVEMRAAEVFEHAERVLDTGDIERVHDMRVATRRLRAALEICEPCFPRKRWRKALKQVKRLADALGERRDRDVTLEFLGEFAREAPAAERGELERLVDELRAEQEDANDALAPFVTEKRLKKLRRRLTKLTKEAGK